MKNIDWLVVTAWGASVGLGIAFWYVVFHMVGSAPRW